MNIKGKIVAFIIMAAMLLQPAAIFAENAKSEDTKSYDYKVDGVTYYEINDGEKLQSYDMDSLVKQAIYSKPAGQKKTVAEYWATLATGILSSNAMSYYSQSSAGFEARFFADPSRKSNGDPANYCYANLPVALSTSNQSRREMYNKDIGSSKRWGDVYTISYGFQKANDITEVLDALCARQGEVNGGKEGHYGKEHFKEWNTKGLENLKVNGPIYYNYIASRDAWGKTWGFCYNNMAILYSDFEVYYATGKDGEGAVLPEGIDKNNSVYDIMNAGKSTAGLKYSSGREGTQVNHENGGDTDSEVTLTASVTETQSVSSSITEEIKFGISSTNKKSFKASILEVCGLTFGKEESKEFDWSRSTESSASGSSESSREKSTTVTIPARTSVQVLTQKDSDSITMEYKTPVAITYKVTIIGFCGNYYDNGAGLHHRNEPCRTFVTQFGSDTRSAREDLLTFANGGSNALTKSWEYEKSSWDTPHQTSLNLGDLQYHMNIYASRSYGLTDYAATINALTTREPYSLFGAELNKEGETVTDSIGAPVSMYPLANVKLANKADKAISVEKGKSADLSEIEMKGLDNAGKEFYNFNTDFGEWKIVDDDGNVLAEGSEVISLKQDKEGDYILKGLKKGEAYIKYFVTDEKYCYRSAGEKKVTHIKSKNVKTPTIEITVEGKEDPDAVNNAETDASANDDAGSDAEDTDVQDAANGTDADDAEAAEEAAEEPAVEISEEERAEILSTLSCDPQYCSIAHAALFVKNHIGVQSSANEIIYTKVLLQLAEDSIGSNHQQAEIEMEAVVWAMQEGLMSHIDRSTAYSGITELEFAQLAYNTAVKYGENISCDDVIDSYSGSEALNSDEKKAMNWAVSKGILNESEESSKTLDTGRPLTSAEVSSFLW